MVPVRSDLRVAQKRKGHKGAVVLIKHGDSLALASGRWMRRTQVVDKVRKLYTKLVTERNGTIVRDVSEPLASHVGRGSASEKNVLGRAAEAKSRTRG